MAGNIKGITITLDGDTRPLQKSLSDVDKQTRNLQGELTQVEKALKFSPGNLELIAQKQQLLTESIQATTTRLDRLKSAQKEVEAQFASGSIGAEQFRAFQREIVKTESKLNGLKDKLSTLDGGNATATLKKDLNQVGKEAKDAENSVSDLAGAIGGVVAGGGIAGAIGSALDSSSLKTKINIAFDVPEESKKSVKDAIKTISAYGIDGESALEGVRRQWALNKTASDEANSAIAKGAAVIAANYASLDFTEVIQETNEIGAALKISNQEAIGMVNALLKAGFPPEQLDIIAEYGTQLKMAGYSAEQIQAIFASGVDTKSWNLDSLIDGIKEGRVNLTAFAQEVPKAIQPLLKDAGISSKQFQQWGKDIATGGQTGAKAMSDLVQAINNIDNATTKNSLGVAVWATLFEDNGQNIIDTLTNANTKTVDLKANQDQLNTSIAQMNADPMVQWNQAVSNMKTAMTPLLEEISKIVSKIAEWISNNPTLAATITAIAIALGILLGIFIALAPVLYTLAAGAIALNIGLGPLILVVIAIVAVIAVLVAAGIALYKNWDKIVAAAKNFAKASIAVFLEIKNRISESLSALGQKVSSIWNNIKTTISNAAQAVYSSVSSKFESVKKAITDPIQSAVSFVKAQVDKIKGFFSGLKISLPKIKLPHFSMKGNFSLSPPSVPKIGVDWYKNGGLFPANSPRLIGIGDANVPEAALPLSDKVLGTIANMISDRMNTVNGTVITEVNFNEPVIIREEADIDKIIKKIEEKAVVKQRAEGVVGYVY